MFKAKVCHKLRINLLKIKRWVGIMIRSTRVNMRRLKTNLCEINWCCSL